MSELKRLLVIAPRWLLLAILVYAPWAYGCVRVWTITGLNILMAALLILWVAGCVVRRTMPQVPLAVWATTGFLFLQGWWMNINVQYYYDRVALKFVPIPSLLSFAPGGLDNSYSWTLMYRISGFLGIICFASDLAQRSEWRRRIAWTICVSGSALILFGLAERILGVNWVAWEEGRLSETSFATYYYHGNAGAFINLVLPLIAGFCALAIAAPQGNTQRAIWIPAVLLAIAGALATASKAAIVITFLLLIAFAAGHARFALAVWQRLGSPAIRWVTAGAIAVVVSALGWFGWDRLVYRWAQEAWVSQSYQLRLMVYEACWSMRVDSGLWGFGPGNFRISFPFYTNHLGNKIEGIWRFAHQDYLQTLVEWGWIGAGVWVVLIGGGIVTGLYHYWRRGSQLGRFDEMFLLTVVLALLGVALHALIDFPLQIPSLQFYVAVYLGIVWGSGSWRKSREP